GPGGHARRARRHPGRRAVHAHAALVRGLDAPTRHVALTAPRPTFGAMETDTRRDRVRASTPRRLNARIDAQTHAHISEVTARGPEAVRRRMAQLDREWDIDRSLMLLVAIAGTAAHELIMPGG